MASHSVSRVFISALALCGMSVLGSACSSTADSPHEGDGGSDAASDAAHARDAKAGCNAGEIFVYAPSSCGGSPTGRCVPPPPPCVSTYCGCDGKTFDDLCGTNASKPFAHAGACADAHEDLDSGVCPPGESLFYAAPGCGAAAKAVCEPSIRDACLGPAACGCDGQTQQGACGSQTKPYAHLGPCDDAGDASPHD